MKSRYFKLHEVLPEKLYKKYGISAWRFIDNRLIQSIDAVKKAFPNGTMTINNYYWGGNRHWSGLRIPESSWYSETSMHSHGKAIDAIFSDYDTEDIRQYIIDNPNEFPFVKGIEMGISWLHIDTRNEEKLVKFNA